MVFFIKITNTLKNLEGIFRRRSIDLNFVETTSKGQDSSRECYGIHLELLHQSLLFHHVKSRFQDISQTFRNLDHRQCFRTKNLVNFIEEEDNVSSFFDFIYQVLNVFFKATTVLSTSFQAQMSMEMISLSSDSSWDITINDGLCQTLQLQLFHQPQHHRQGLG